MILLKGGDYVYRFRNYVPVRLKNGDWLPNQAIVMYTLINMYTSGHDGLFSYNMPIECLGMELFDNTELTTRQRKSVKDGLYELSDCITDVIKPMNDKSTIWNIDIERFYTLDDEYQYTYCYNEDFMAILKNKDSRTYNLAGFYMKFLSTFDYRYNVGRISLDYVAKVMELSSNTVKTNVDKLKKIGVLKSYKGEIRRNKKGEYVSSPNVYYRPCEEDLAIEYINTMSIPVQTD